MTLDSSLNKTLLQTGGPGEPEQSKQLVGYNLHLPNNGGLINLKLNFSSSVPPTDPRISNPAMLHLAQAFRRGGYTEKTSEELTMTMLTIFLTIFFSGTNSRPGSSRSARSFTTGNPLT